MKKYLKLILVLIVGLFLVGCKKEKEPQKSAYVTELDTYMADIIPATMTKGFDIPLEYNFTDGVYATLDWSTEDSNVVSISKKGKVLYLSSLFDTTATIKCDIYVEGSLNDSTKYTFNVKGDMTTDEYISKFNEIYLPDTIYKSIELAKVEDKIFKSRGLEGSITYTSSNENILSSDGKYTLQSDSDTNLTFSYVVNINDFTIKGSKVIKVEGRQDQTLVDRASNWLDDIWNVSTIKEDLDFPTTDDKGKVDMVWSSGAKDIVDDSGKFVRWKVDVEIPFEVTISINDYSVVKELKMRTISEEEAIEYIMNVMHQDDYYQSYFYTYIVSGGHANDDYGMLNFYTLDLDESKLVKKELGSGNIYGKNSYNENTNESEFSVRMVSRSLSVKRPQDIKTSTEFITVHDTGDNKFNAQQWGDEITTSSRQVSWHFTVDDKEIIQHIPLDEVAYHAGDGGSVYGLKDTGVKYTIAKPNIKVGDDGYYYINNQKSYLRAPYIDGEYKKDITPAGIYTCLGKNGNYYMNNTYYNSTYNKISNCGGNYYSIGIESCVHNGVEYSKVQKRLANLIAHLLNMYDLDPSRVLLHRSFSGKYCPQSMIRASEYGQNSQFTLEAFYKMIDIEYFIIKYLPSLDVTYTSLNKDVLSDSGEILKYVTEDTKVSYTVNATYNGHTYTHTYETTIHPKDN